MFGAPGCLGMESAVINSERVRRSARIDALSPSGTLPRRGAVVFDGAAEAFVETGAGAEAELPFGAGYVEAAAGLAVGLGGVPDGSAGEAGEAGDYFGEVADGDFRPAPRLTGSGSS